MITAASAAAQKLGLKVKQMDVVMGILSERKVLIKRCGKSVMVACPKTLFIFSITSSSLAGHTHFQGEWVWSNSHLAFVLHDQQ